MKVHSKCMAAALALCLSASAGAQTGERPLTKEKGVTVVTTTTIAPQVRGFKGPTPVKIYIRKNKVVKVEALPNTDSPKYFSMATNKLLTVWDGKSVKEARKMRVDAVSGATFSSKGLIGHVQAGLDYYEKNK